MYHTEPFVPRFEKYYTGAWPHEQWEGVGLIFSGAPTDLHAFIDIMQGHGCPPTATRRIMEDLIAGRTRYTTVRSHFDFNDLGDRFAEVGVTMQITAPIPEPANTHYDSVAFRMLQGDNGGLEGLSEAEVAHVRSLHAVAAASIERLPHHFGSFA